MKDEPTQIKKSKIADCVDDIVESFKDHDLDPFDIMAALIIITSTTMRSIAKHSHVPVSVVRSEYEALLANKLRKDALQR
jgi:hypothetical protein